MIIIWWMDFCDGKDVDKMLLKLNCFNFYKVLIMNIIYVLCETCV